MPSIPSKKQEKFNQKFQHVKEQRVNSDGRSLSLSREGNGERRRRKYDQKKVNKPTTLTVRPTSTQISSQVHNALHALSHTSPNPSPLKFSLSKIQTRLYCTLPLSTPSLVTKQSHFNCSVPQESGTSGILGGCIYHFTLRTAGLGVYTAKLIQYIRAYTQHFRASRGNNLRLQETTTRGRV